MSIPGSTGLFILAGLCEIGGGYLADTFKSKSVVVTVHRAEQ